MKTTLKKQITLNPYTIHWLALVPLKGVATKADGKIASKLVSNYNSYFSVSKFSIFTHQPNKEAAIEKILKIKGKLSKKYKAYIFTDKQFGLASKDGNLNIIGNGNLITLTKKQIDDAIIV